MKNKIFRSFFSIKFFICWGSTDFLLGNFEVVLKAGHLVASSSLKLSLGMDSLALDQRQKVLNGTNVVKLDGQPRVGVVAAIVSNLQRSLLRLAFWTVLLPVLSRDQGQKIISVIVT